jgi:hypothetical protein
VSHRGVEAETKNRKSRPSWSAIAAFISAAAWASLMTTIALRGSSPFSISGRSSFLIHFQSAIRFIMWLSVESSRLTVACFAPSFTGGAVAVAFSSANMTATALACRSLYPDADIVILADDDPHLIDHPKIKKNLGIEAAYAAAAAVGGRVALPPRQVAA